MIKNYLKTAWRNLLKNRMTTCINIFGLSVGMTAAILIFLWVQNELQFDNTHPHAENIYRLKTSLTENNWIWETTPLLLADAAKKDIPEIEYITRLNGDNAPVFAIKGKPYFEKKCVYVDDDWFRMFHYDFIKGNAASFLHNPNSLILTESSAKKYFGQDEALGSTIRIEGKNYLVKAVVKDSPANSSFQYDAYLPMAALLSNDERRKNDENWDNYNYITFAKLIPGAGIRAVENKLTTILPGKSSTAISLISLADMHFENDVQSSVFVHGHWNTVYIFSILAFLLLLIACINYVNLTTANASLRIKEVSVKKMMGAKRAQLFYQFFTESLLISIISLVVTLILLQFCLPYFNQLTDKNFVSIFRMASLWQVMGVTLTIALLLNSIYPALLLSAFKPLNVFRGSSVPKLNDAGFRKGLVVVQFTISVILIVCTLVIYRQMQFIQQSNPGYNRSQVLSVAMPGNVPPDKREAVMQNIKQNLLAQSSIKNVTMANQSVVNIGSFSTRSADWNGHDTTLNPKIAQLSTDADFKQTMQLQMKQGRWLRSGNMADKNNVVLNETAVSILHIPTPVIGQRFTFKGRTGQIIGVVKDFHYASMHEKTGPLIAFNDSQWFNYFHIRITPGNAAKAISDIQKVWDSALPGQPVEYSFLDDTFNSLYKDDRKTSFLILVFSVIAILLSSLGLFGLATFTAGQRTKEIGIRKVLGASVANITALLSREFVLLIGIAIIIAVPVSLLVMQKWMGNFAYRISISWWIFIAAGGLAFSIALFTISFQAVKAALANPVRSLRSE